MAVEKKVSVSRKLTDRAQQRLEEKAKVAGPVAQTLRVLDKAQARKELFGDSQPPESAKYVLKCVSCNRIVLFTDELPYRLEGLAPKDCKGCGKRIPYRDSKRTRYADEACMTVDELIQAWIKLRGEQQQQEKKG